jgi:hypothetical protein
MIRSNRSLRSDQGRLLSAAQNNPGLPPNLVGWLIQIAFLSVIQEACETFSGSRGSYEGHPTAGVSKPGFSLKFHSERLLSKLLG